MTQPSKKGPEFREAAMKDLCHAGAWKVGMRFSEGKHIFSASLNRTPDPRLPGALKGGFIGDYMGELYWGY